MRDEQVTVGRPHQRRVAIADADADRSPAVAESERIQLVVGSEVEHRRCLITELLQLRTFHPVTERLLRGHLMTAYGENEMAIYS